MRILLVHNFYRTSAPSGEDEVVRTERDLLESGGHTVVSYERYNDAIGAGANDAVRSALSNVWSTRARSELESLLRKHRPDVAHFHNVFPQISVAGYAACAAYGVPVVQTLHNFRSFCANGLLQRAGRPCELCVDQLPWPALRYRCYRDSFAATAGMSLATFAHRVLRTHGRYVAKFIALTQFAAQRFARAGFPVDRIVVRGNALARDPGPGSGDGGYALFVGRLTAEKGVATLIRAWRELPHMRLKVIGDGELRPALERDATGLPIEFLGRQPPAAVIDAMRAARVVVIPSECYEGFPRVFVEALATGTPLVASNLGGLGELVSEQHGRKFTAGDAAELAQTVRILLDDESTLARMRQASRERYLAAFSPQTALESLVGIYRASVATA
jgi:glycosyltransferase involved in cell wall biosynthesis